MALPGVGEAALVGYAWDLLGSVARIGGDLADAEALLGQGRWPTSRL